MRRSRKDAWRSAGSSPKPAVRRILRRRESQRDGPRAILRRAARELCEWRDFDCPWRHEPFAREAEIDALMTELHAVGELADNGDPEDWLAQSLAGIRRFVNEATRLETVRGRDYEWPGGAAQGLGNLNAVFTGVGPFRHDDPRDRPAAVFGADVTLHVGPDRPAHVLLPVIPPRRS